jgi:3-hydroxyisobutyrate dehydrogenase-like beta-hydroxyacid dehydrogenase
MARGVSPGTPFGPKVALKGVGPSLGEAEAAGIRLRLAELMQERLQYADDHGLSDEDWSVALSKLARERTVVP